MHAFLRPLPDYMFRQGGRGGPPPTGYFPDFFDLFMGGGVAPPFGHFFASSMPVPPQSSEDAHPPASKRFVATLPEVVITKEDLDVETSNAECAICLNDQRIGQSATRMPCGHLFCDACLRRWLVKSNTCPVCRYEVETDDPDYERVRLTRMKDRKMRFRHRELEAKSVGELRQILRMLNISTEGCIEKGDMIKRLEDSPKVEMVRTTTAQQVYQLHELMRLDPEALRRLMQGLGVRVSPSVVDKFSLIRALANSGRVIVGTEGASPEDMAKLQREASTSVGLCEDSATANRGESRLPRTQAVRGGGGTCQYSKEQLEGMRVGQLKELLVQRNIPLDGLIEKQDLIDRLSLQ